jgi:predicted kinase
MKQPQAEPARLICTGAAPREADRADARLQAGRLGEAELCQIAQRLAILHESETVDPDATRAAGPRALAARVRSLRDEASIAERDNPLLARSLGRLVATQEHFVATHSDWIQARLEAQRIRAGAHDRRLGDVWIDDDGNVGLVDDGDHTEEQHSLPGRDGCVPVAGLSVDLASRGFPDLAERLLAAYAGAYDDYALYRVVDFYERDRAWARAREQLRVSVQSDAKIAEREAAAAEAKRLIDFACATARRPLLPPVVVALGGLVASGKSTVAQAVADRMASPRIVGDHVRAFRMGATPSHDATTIERLESLEPGFEERVTRSFFSAAECVLDSGRAVVLDAGFPTAARRAAARALAERHGLPFRFIECRVDAKTAQRRLAERDTSPDEHGGWRAIYDRYLARWESPEDDLAPEELVVVDTTRPLDETLAGIESRLPLWAEDASA